MTKVDEPAIRPMGQLGPPREYALGISGDEMEACGMTEETAVGLLWRAFRRAEERDANEIEGPSIEWEGSYLVARGRERLG